MKKVVVVTGGSEGIGEACVEIFNQREYEVINLDIVSLITPNRVVIILGLFKQIFPR